MENKNFNFNFVQQELTKIFNNNLKIDEIENLVSIIIENEKLRNHVKELEKQVEELKKNHSLIAQNNILELVIEGQSFDPSIQTFVFRNFAKFKAFIDFKVEKDFKYGIRDIWWTFTLNSKEKDFNELSYLIDNFKENWIKLNILSLKQEDTSDVELLWD